MTTAKSRQQRLSNFKQALDSLTEALEQETFNDLEKNGVIQRFEFTYEMAWQTLQDYLSFQGYNVKGPKPVIRQAFEDGYIHNWRGWNDLHEDRQKTVHTYDKVKSNEIFQAVKDFYWGLLSDLYRFLAEEAKASNDENN